MYRAPEELQAVSPSGLERLPVRPLIALSVVLAIVIGAAGYLRTSLRRKQQAPVITSVTAVRADVHAVGDEAPVVPPGLQHDAAQHAKLAERLVNEALGDLSAAQGSLDTVRPYARSEVDQAADKVESARRNLDAARLQLKVVRALIARK